LPRVLLRLLLQLFLRFFLLLFVDMYSTHHANFFNDVFDRHFLHSRSSVLLTLSLIRLLDVPSDLTLLNLYFASQVLSDVAPLVELASVAFSLVDQAVDEAVVNLAVYFVFEIFGLFQVLKRISMLLSRESPLFIEVHQLILWQLAIGQRLFNLHLYSPSVN